MALMLATTIFGAGLAAGPLINWWLMGMVLVNAFLYLYVAHLNDTMFDVIKGEYEKDRKLHAVRLNDTAYLPRLGFGLEVPGAPILPRNHYLGGILVCSVLGTLIAWWLSTVVGWLYLPLALTGLALALTYSAGLDKVPALGDTMWEIGVIAALFCGYYAMRGVLDAVIIQTAAVLLVALVSVKAIDSWYDTITDDRIDKVTLTVFLYRRGLSLRTIRDIAYVPLYVALVILFTQLQPLFYLGLVVGTILIVFSHVYYRNTDMEKRMGIVIGGIGVLAFIFWAIFAMTGIL
jgi:4-hydroxybenzoate polyprenyltransferase